MNKKQFLEYIVPKVERYFNELEFVYKKSKDGFAKAIDDGWITVSFSFYQFAETDNINVGFELRKNSVEELFVKYIDINPSNHKTTPTVIFALTSLCRHPDNSFRFTDEIGLDEIISSKIIPFINNDLPIFVKKYSELKNIFKLYTDSGEENNDKILRSYNNYVHALIIGRLISPDDFEKVIAWCDSKLVQLKNNRPHSLDAELYDKDFNNIVADLKTLKL